MQYNDGSNSATILFKSSHIRDSVLSKAEHIITIDNQQIKLKVYKPSDVEKQADRTGPKTEQACGYQEPNQSEPSVMVLENLPDDFNQDVLTLLVEDISRLPDYDFSMELIPELRKAVVTFKNPNAAEKFLEESRTHEKFKQYNLRACALERSTCVRVENLPAEANNSKMLLELYFEKWGGPVEEVITIPSEQAAIIIFKEEEAKERVLKQENNICDVPVKIYPYFKSLDTILYGGNRTHLKRPGLVEREKNSVKEYMEISPALYSLLEQDGLKSAVSPQLCIDYNKKMNRLVLSGLHTEILAIKNWVLEKKVNMKQKHLQIDRSILEFLRSVDCDEMSRDLFISHGITAVYTIENGDVVVTGSTERALNEAEKMINTVLTTKHLIVEDQCVLQMPEWHDLKELLLELFNTSKKTSVFISLSKQRDKIIVTGFREPVLEVSENFGYFTEKHTRIEETVHVKSHAVVTFLKDRKSQHWQHFIKSNEVKVNFHSKRPWIKLSGECTFVQPAMIFFKKLADGLYTDTLILRKSGAKKYFKDQGKMMLSMLLKEKRFVVVLQDDDMLEEEGNFFHGTLGRISTSSPGMHAMQVHGLNQNKFRSFDTFWQGKILVGEEIEPAVFQLCGETQEDLSEAKDMISSLILQEHVTIPIPDPAITHFTSKDAETLNVMQRELTVSVWLEKKGQDSVITLEGLTRDVHTAENHIQDMIRKVKRKEKREAFFISSMVQHLYQKNRHSAKNFEMLTSYELEQSYYKRQPTVRMKINNDEYEADFVRKEATRRRLGIELNSIDLKVGAQSPLPSHWEDMKGQPVVLVKLTAGSKEYADVEKEFRRTNLNSNIIKIERVQNSALWRNYMIKKEELEVKNKHKNNEKLLFHGTAPDKTDQINHHGFNRSFAGMHGAMYGNGTYFAVDPRYSAQRYSKCDANGHKCMYLARVLVGDYTQGKQGLPVPPAKSSKSVDLYNSVTDNMNNPTMFVIFNDVQAYPEYLLTFQQGRAGANIHPRKNPFHPAYNFLW
ncbi:hypothetical protein G5714_010986 [Onychostoma macrolepis]|uniref:Poly [ADP-ribose] polymerase n=2 Tax=Onychostoma macrolepis TaxID=369639 RepID=A0A7J6CLP5_9TELE|nr:hypothetical protein G5714_010986 [Onychostoma macrolepis]